MDARKLLELLTTAERLKDATRHCYTSGGRHESVAEHSFMTALMAFYLKDEFPEADIDKVIKMCLIHDFGEAVMGDIPSFLKTAEDEEREREAIAGLLSRLPAEMESEFSALFAEMDALATPEAKLFKALDNMEAVVSHNEADIATWLPLEYEENLVYGAENCEWSEWTRGLRAELRRDSEQKLKDCGITK